MISEQQVVTKAVHLKTAMVSRAERMEQLANDIAKAKSGLVYYRSERVETMEAEFGSLVESQQRDGKYFATLRWVLGCTDDIDPDNLELDT